MWGRGLLLLSVVSFGGCSRYVLPRYVPHYDLLDPATGRSLRNPRTSPSGLFRSRIFYQDDFEDEDDDDVGYVRPQREINQQQHKYALPIGNLRDHIKKTSGFRSGRHFGSPFLTPERERHQDPEDSEEPFRETDADSVFPTFSFNRAGSNEQKYAGLIRSNSHNSASDDQSYNYAMRNALYNSQLAAAGGVGTSSDGADFGTVPLSAGFLSSADTVLVTPDNSFNGVQLAYKWRKKYPYYGRGRRRRRSAQKESYRLPSPLRRRQTTWVLLDPLTGRVKNTPFKDSDVVLKPKSQVVNNQEFQQLDSRIQSRAASQDGEFELLENDSRRPVYKFHQRNPYNGR